MDYFLFAGYLLLFAWIVTKIKFFTGAGFTKSQILIFFLLKVMAGIIYGWVGIYYGQTAMMVDTWNFHYMGLHEYKLMQSHPVEYLTNIFRQPAQNDYLNFLTAKDSLWNELKAKFIVKLISAFDIFSFGNYYVNVIFFSFITLFGPMSLYRVMKDMFPGANVPSAIGVFLIPSFLYWSSGIHKDGLLFTGICFIVYHFYFSIKANRFRPRSIFFIIAGFLLIIFLRNFLLILIFPALIAWVLSSKFPKKIALVFTIVYITSGTIFFTAKYIHPKLDFPAIVSEKQSEFLDMYGGSMVQVKKLQPDFKSFLNLLPQAIDLSIFRPHAGDVIHLLSLTAFIEAALIWLLLIIFILFPKKKPANKAFIYFCIFFSFSLLLCVGYTVNFVGAIVRYRSIVLPFLITPMLALTDWAKVKNVYRRITGNES